MDAGAAGLDNDDCVATVDELSGDVVVGVGVEVATSSMIGPESQRPLSTRSCRLWIRTKTSMRIFKATYNIETGSRATVSHSESVYLAIAIKKLMASQFQLLILATWREIIYANGHTSQKNGRTPIMLTKVRSLVSSSNRD